MKKMIIALITVVLSCTVSYGAPFPTADDFIPLVRVPEEKREEETKVAEPEKVVEVNDPVLGVPIVKGLSDKDAINHIYNRSFKNGIAECSTVAMTYGGYGFVATGVYDYAFNMKNPTARRIAQRNAYVGAFMDAKRKMSGTVQGLAVKGFTNFDNTIQTSDTDEKSLRNSSQNTTEVNNEAVKAVLSGLVTYAVSDDIDFGKNIGHVYVMIVSTPKSRGAFQRVVDDTISAESLNAGLNAIMDEIRSELVAPVGGKVIQVKTTGEVGFIGYGSSVVRQDDDPLMRSQLLRAARRTAEMRANDALCGIIVGDKFLADTHSDEQTRQSTRDFERVMKEDPINGVVTAQDIELAHGRQKDFRNDMNFSEVMESARRGQLPPGVNTRAWLDKNEEMAYAVAVYIPSLSDAAANAAREMRQNKILRPANPDAPSNNTIQKNTSNKNNNAASQSNTQNEKKQFDITPGASGIIEQDL